MKYTPLLKKLWGVNTLTFMTGFYSLSIMACNSLLRLGRFIKPVIAMGVKAQITSSSEELKAQLNLPVTRSIKLIDSENSDYLKAQYSDLNHIDIKIIQDVLVLYGVDDEGCLQICIRGSSNISNWLDNVNADMQWDATLNSMVHDGYQEIATAIAEDFRTYHQHTTPEQNAVTIQGYSMGGGLAILVALHLESDFDLKKVYSIAGPKVVQKDYGNLPVMHLMHIQDPVPYLPTWSLFTPYRHQGLRVLIDKSGEFKLFRDSYRTDIYASIWTLRHSIDFSAHTSYRTYFI